MDTIFDGRLLLGLVSLSAGFAAGTMLGHRLGSRIGAMVSSIEARLIAVEHMLGIGTSSAPEKKPVAPFAAASPATTTAAASTHKA